MPPSASSDSEPVVIPGGRDVRGTLQTPVDADRGRCVVACPPDPRHGGDRRDPRLRAIADALCDEGIASLRIDYGPWDEGRSERLDVQRAVDWVADRYVSVGLVGYSVGATLALVAARDLDVGAVSAVAPPARIASLDGVEGVAHGDVPGQVLVGDRDATVESESLVDAAREAGWEVVTVEDDHHVRRSRDEVATEVATFQLSHLG